MDIQLPDWHIVLFMSLLVLVTSFARELMHTNYTIAISNDQIRPAVAYTALLNIMAWIIMIVVVSHLYTFPADLIGETSGTYVAMKWNRMKNRPLNS